MSLDVLKQIKEAEQASFKRHADALIHAKEMIANAESAGQKALADARIRAQARVRQILLEAEEKASGCAKEKRKEIQSICEKMRTIAEEKMNYATALIVERVVSI